MLECWNVGILEISQKNTTPEYTNFSEYSCVIISAPRIREVKKRNHMCDFFLKIFLLFSESELFDESRVASFIFFLEVVEELTTFCYHHHDTTTRVIVLLVRLEVRLEIFDTSSKYGNLNFWRTCVSFVCSVCFHERLFFFVFHSMGEKVF